MTDFAFGLNPVELLCVIASIWVGTKLVIRFLLIDTKDFQRVDARARGEYSDDNMFFYEVCERARNNPKLLKRLREALNS